jgi:sporulation protein YlmC with PRC-barrel domain
MELSRPHDAISALLGTAVVGRDGRRLGRVRDVLVERGADGRWTVTELRVARRRLSRRTWSVPWRDVVELGERGLVVD